jgi:hypothetical protein
MACRWDWDTKKLISPGLDNLDAPYLVCAYLQWLKFKSTKVPIGLSLPC